MASCVQNNPFNPGFRWFYNLLRIFYNSLLLKSFAVVETGYLYFIVWPNCSGSLYLSDHFWCVYLQFLAPSTTASTSCGVTVHTHYSLRRERGECNISYEPFATFGICLNSFILQFCWFFNCWNLWSSVFLFISSKEPVWTAVVAIIFFVITLLNCLIERKLSALCSDFFFVLSKSCFGMFLNRFFVFYSF